MESSQHIHRNGDVKCSNRIQTTSIIWRKFCICISLN